MSELGKRDAADFGGPEGVAKRLAGEAGLEGGTPRAPLRRGDLRARVAGRSREGGKSGRAIDERRGRRVLQ